MKGNLRWATAAAWMLLFIILDAVAFKGRAAWLNTADFTFAFVLAASFYIKDLGAAAAAFAAGVFLDSFSPVPIHTPFFVGAYYIARLHEKLFYYPGSPVHVLSFIPVIFLESFLEFLAAGDVRWAADAPVAGILAAGAVNCALFLAMLALFRKRDKAVMFKMR